MDTLLIDIELAPHKAYIWGLRGNKYIPVDRIAEPGYVLCYAAKWLGSREVFFDSIRDSSPQKMLKGVHRLLDRADCVMHFNGDSFDIPVLDGEFLEYGFKPYAPFKGIDLYKAAKRFRYPSLKLDYICQRLGLGRKTRHKGMELWTACMAGDEAAWKKMEQYNRQDVKLLEQLYNVIQPWMRKHPNMGLYVDSKKPICPGCGSSSLEHRGTATTTAGKYQRYQCNGCGRWSRGAQNLLTPEKRRATLRGV